MNIFYKIALLLGMFFVLGLAFVLPKFVQRTSIVDQEQDLATVLANVEHGSLDVKSGDLPILEKIADKQEVVKLSSAEQIDAFTVDLSAGNLKSAERKLVTLSPSLDYSTHQKLAAKLSLAKRALVNSSEQLDASKELAELKKLQKESLAELRSSLKELDEVKKIVKNAVKERESVPVSTVASPPKIKKKLPKPISVSFKSDSSVLSKKGEGLLSLSVIFLKKDESLSLQLRGYSDKSGSAVYNGLLSQARCEIVRDYLLSEGISGKRISVVSFGETQSSVQGNQNARRVDLVFREM